MPDVDEAVTASATERTAVEYPSDLGDMLHRLRDEATAEIAEEYDEDGTPLPVDLEVKVEMTMHDRDPEVEDDA